MTREQENSELFVRKIVSAMKDPEYLPTVSESRCLLDTGISIAKKELDLPVFEFFTKEYIKAFGDYLTSRVSVLQEQKKDPVKILEVAAGNGRLSQLLRKEMSTRKEDVIIKATDSGEQKGIKKLFPVEKMDHQKAVKKYRPDIVICSWMPPGQDLTSVLRQEPSVQEYIVIGPEESECGKPWETFGLEEYRPLEKTKPPFEEEGFMKQELPELTSCQVVAAGKRLSKTISFKRI